MAITDHIQTLKDTDTIGSAQVTSNVITQGNIAIEASVVTQNFAADTYTGNGTSQDIVTGINSVDFTVASNGSGFWHDRTTGDCTVKNDAGDIIASGTAVVNTSKVHIKIRSLAYSNYVFDSLRGSGMRIETDLTNSEALTAEMFTSFNIDGFTVGNRIETNTNLATYIAYQTLYTHIKWGLTSQGKRYVEAYNPVTREGMIMYQGSGVAGHEIPHSMGVELDYADIKNLDSAQSWLSGLSSTGRHLDTSDIFVDLSAFRSFTIDAVVHSGIDAQNNAANTYIMYYKAKSPTWSTGTYIGTGSAGNFIETKDVNGVARKPARVIIKCVSANGNWNAFDNKRVDERLRLDTSDAEVSTNDIDIISNGFNLINVGTETNFTDYKYYYEVYFDTNADGGGSYFDLPTDDTNLNLTATIPNYTDGKDENGFVRSTESVTGTIDFTGVSDGFKWVAKEEGGSYVFYDKKPSVGLYEKESADDNRLVFDTETGTHWNTTGAELLSGGNFDSQADVDLWVLQDSTATLDNGRMLITTTTTNLGIAYRSFSVVIGETYIVEFNITAGNNIAHFGISEQYSTLTTNSNSGLTSIVFIAEAELMYVSCIADNGAIGKTAYFDNISVYKTEPTLGSALTTPISFIPNAVMVQSETPQYLDENQTLFENVMEDLEVAGKVKAGGDVKTGGEFIGKNACTAWVNFDGSTTPPTIRDSFNVSDVVRNAAGYFTVYYLTPMNNLNYSASGMCSAQDDNNIMVNALGLDWIAIITESGTVNTDFAINTIQIFGGKD